MREQRRAEQLAEELRQHLASAKEAASTAAPCKREAAWLATYAAAAPSVDGNSTFFTTAIATLRVDAPSESAM